MDHQVLQIFNAAAGDGVGGTYDDQLPVGGKGDAEIAPNVNEGGRGNNESVGIITAGVNPGHTEKGGSEKGGSETPPGGVTISNPVEDVDADFP